MGKHYGLDIPTLRELRIDVDKEWVDEDGQPRGITLLKEIAAAMAKGDLPVRGGDVLVKITPGPISYVLTSGGPGHLPVWLPAPGPLELWLAAVIELSHTIAKVAVDKSHNENAPLASEHKMAYLDAPADMIKRLTPSVSLSDVETVLAGPDQAIAKTSTPRSALSILCDGFVEETAAAVQTDHTAEAREATANDLNLNPMSDTVLDKVYIGSAYKFWQAQVKVGISGVGNWTNTWYYWNGAWTPIVGEIDGAVEWQFGAGLGMISHTPQGDWVPTIIQGMNLYWLMSRTDNFVSRTTKPLGSQIWVAIA